MILAKGLTMLTLLAVFADSQGCWNNFTNYFCSLIPSENFDKIVEFVPGKVNVSFAQKRVEKNNRGLRPQCSVTMALTMCQMETHEKNTDFGCPDADDVLNTKYDFDRQQNQVLNLIKSILLARSVSESDTEDSCLEIIVFTNRKGAFDKLKKEIFGWEELFTKSLRLTYRPAIYPKEFEFMGYYYGPCASLRLFMPRLLPDIDSIIYSDTDMLYFHDIRKLWKEFSFFGPETIVAMAEDQYGHTTDPPTINYPGNSGINSGLILMNLTRIRNQKNDWIPSVEVLNSNIRMFDQDILNHYFYSRPEQLRLLPCHWNFQDIFCRPELLCVPPVDDGIHMLHGSGHRFTSSGSEPRYFEIYKEFQNLKLKGSSFNRSIQNFIENISHRLENIDSQGSLCDKRIDFNQIVLQGLQHLRRLKSKLA